MDVTTTNLTTQDIPSSKTRIYIYRRTSTGEWKRVRGLVYEVRASAERCIARSRETLEIREGQ